MKKLIFAGGLLGVGLTTLLVLHDSSQAADHLDGPGAAANPMADLADVYAWTSSDASKLNLAMTVSPADDGSRSFGPSVQYVFHVVSKANLGIGETTGTETKVICTFASNNDAQCWVGDKDYVHGDPTATAGLTSASGKVKVFAGRRSDPFFFNLGGFKSAVEFVQQNAAALTKDAAGCPLLSGPAADELRRRITTTPTEAHAPCAANQADCFANFNVMAIVLQVDKTLLNAGSNNVVSVWGSTHTAP